MKRALVLLTVLAFLVTGATATTIETLTVEDLTRAASNVVIGRAVRSWSEWDAEHKHIYTYTVFEVSKALKGAQSSTLTVKQLGGSDGKVMLHVSGVRRFQNGENALLFLKPSAQDNSMLVVGLMQGNFRLQKAANGEWLASNGVPGVSVARRGSPAAEYRGSVMKLTEIENRVQRVVQK